MFCSVFAIDLLLVLSASLVSVPSVDDLELGVVVFVMLLVPSDGVVVELLWASLPVLREESVPKYVLVDSVSVVPVLL